MDGVKEHHCLTPDCIVIGFLGPQLELVKVRNDDPNKIGYPVDDVAFLRVCVLASFSGRTNFAAPEVFLNLLKNGQIIGSQVNRKSGLIAVWYKVILFVVVPVKRKVAFAIGKAA